MRPLPALLSCAAMLLIACKEPTASPSSTSTTGAKPTASAQVSAAPSATSAPSGTATAATAEQTPPTKIAAQHLLVAYKGAASAPKDVKRTKEEARKRAEEASKKAKGGEDFSALVAEYSDDPTKANRGNLGVFTRDKMLKEFSDAAFALPVDGVSGVVETKYGFHVIKRNQ